MLIAVLLRKPWLAEWQPAEVVNDLRYTTMTLSRAASGHSALRNGSRRASDWRA
jgi:hypothetical protein